MNDKLSLSVGLAHELEQAFSRNGFTSAHQIKKMSKGDFLGQIWNVQNGFAKIIPESHTVDMEKPNYWTGSWNILEHLQWNQKSTLIRNVQTLSLSGCELQCHVSDSQCLGNKICGTALREEMRNLRAMNANLLDYLLANQELIPKDWQVIRRIFFWGTVYEDKFGGIVRFMVWSVTARRWNGNSRRLSEYWYRHDPALVLAG